MGRSAFTLPRLPCATSIYPGSFARKELYQHALHALFPLVQQIRESAPRDTRKSWENKCVFLEKSLKLRGKRFKQDIDRETPSKRKAINYVMLCCVVLCQFMLWCLMLCCAVLSYVNLCFVCYVVFMWFIMFCM